MTLEKIGLLIATATTVLLVVRVSALTSRLEQVQDDVIIAHQELSFLRRRAWDAIPLNTGRATKAKRAALTQVLIEMSGPLAGKEDRDA